MGRFTIAAKHHETIAGIFESEVNKYICILKSILTLGNTSAEKNRLLFFVLLMSLEFRLRVENDTYGCNDHNDSNNGYFDENIQKTYTNFISFEKK